MSSQPPLSPAEQAAAEALAAVGNEDYAWAGPGYFDASDWENEARAAVAAVRSQIEADALEALADAAVAYGPATADHMRGVAFMVRQGRTSVRDWLAADTSLSRPTPEETPQ
jgi:hypothetical protein